MPADIEVNIVNNHNYDTMFGRVNRHIVIDDTTKSSVLEHRYLDDHLRFIAENLYLKTGFKFRFFKKRRLRLALMNNYSGEMLFSFVRAQVRTTIKITMLSTEN